MRARRPWRASAALLAALAAPLLPGDARADERIAEVTAPTEDFSKPESFESNPGGAGTYRGATNRNAFSQPAGNISFEDRATFNIGNAVFRRLWVSSPASTKSSDGLGPLFNARACQHCHLKDGRGHPPAANYPDDTAQSMLMRLSVPPRSEAERALLEGGQAPSIPEPVYGGQLQDLAVQGHLAEGKVHTEWREFPVELDGGEIVSLREPTYSITHLGYGPLDSEVMMSVRVAPQMIGLGLLEAIPEVAILAHADPEDSDGDGISGKASRVWSPSQGEMALGRFGWKAGKATLDDQNTGAFNGDIGISTHLASAPWGDCTEAQSSCRDTVHGIEAEGEVEVGEELVAALEFYTRALAVPARRDVGEPEVLRGKEFFYALGCTSCHVPKYVTAEETDHPAFARQLIWPYTDLLLHDMGEGLADGRPDGLASGREWRTPPLWGIGLTQAVNGHSFFLHDGRARNLTEAILWHGGEAESARDGFAALPPEDRAALLAFLNSL